MRIERAALGICWLCAALGCGPTREVIERQTEPYIRLCGQYLQSGETDAALEACKEAESIDEENADLFSMIGIIYASKKQYESAEEYYLKAIELQPTHPQAHTNYGSMLSQQGRHAEAIERFKIALADPSSNTFILHMNYGTACMEIDNYACAEDHYQRALREAPQACMANLRLGELREKLRQYPEAIERFESCVTNCGESALCRFRLGESYLQQNRLKSALKQFAHICDKQPNAPESIESCKYVRIYRAKKR